MDVPSTSFGGRFQILAALLISLLFGEVRPMSAQEEGIYTIKPVEDKIVWAVAFAPNGKTFAATQHKLVLIYETASKKLWRTLKSKSKKQEIDGYEDWIMGLDFSPDGKLLAGARADGTVSLWSTSTLEELVRLDASKNWILAVRFSPDGTLLATGSRDRKVLIWDVKEQKVKTSLIGHANWVHCMDFSPDGHLLASGSEDGTVRLWEVASGRQIHSAKASTQSVMCVSFTPDGKTLLSGCQKNKVQIWDVATGQNKGTLIGHMSTVQSVHFLPDSRIAVTASRDGTVRAWDINKQVQIGSVLTAPRENSIESTDLSEDKKYVLCGAFDSAIRLIEVDQLLKNR